MLHKLFDIIFKFTFRLGMNCIIDISDTSEESHMSLFCMEDQNEIKAKLTEAFCEARQPEYDCDAIETIIKKVSGIYFIDSDVYFNIF